jgi:hypothetical protein
VGERPGERCVGELVEVVELPNKRKVSCG